MTHRLLITAVLVALGLTLFAAPAPAAARSCGSIAFTPNSDEGVSDIRAHGVSCRVARRVARGSDNHGPSGEPGKVFRYRSGRFRCRGVEQDTALPSVRYRCVRGSALVRFVKT